MGKFQNLEKMLPAAEDAQEAFELHLIHVCDDEKVAAATEAFNKVLRRAAAALLRDMKHSPLAHRFLEEWRPQTPTDTWFGPDPAQFLRHIVRDGIVHRMGLPGVGALR